MTDTEATRPGPVFVQVVEVDVEGDIGWRDNLAEQLGDRSEDIRHAIAAGAKAVTDSLPQLPGAQGWKMKEVSASFGVTLTAEAGAILSKASAGATFEVNVTYQREWY
jgi:hypothetical protein